MEACHVKRGQGSCISIPQIPVGKLAYQNCSRDQLSPRGGLELHRPQWLSIPSEFHTNLASAVAPPPGKLVLAPPPPAPPSRE